jgi:cystathionine beta-lyase
MQYNFDQILDRRHSDSFKWRIFEENVIPLWVADMDFVSPEPVIRALHERTNHGVFGYAGIIDNLPESIIAWLQEHFDWKVEPEALIYVPGVVVGFNLATQALVQPGQAVAYQTPVYMPFLDAGRSAGVESRSSALCRDAKGRYTVDWEAFEASMDGNTAMFLMCSPHNPVGRVWERWELERMAEICLRKNVTICSDEIHADLVFAPHRHIPIAALDAEVARNTVTLMAPSKTFNIPGLGFSFAVVPDADMRKKIQTARRGLVGGPSLMGMVGAEAAYRDGREWLEQVLVYMRANRDFMVDWIGRELPELNVFTPEGTYLAWIDCRAVPTDGKSPMKFLLEKGRVAFNDGAAFGPGGEGFVRLNFACPRETLEEGLKRLRLALRGK